MGHHIRFLLTPGQSGDAPAAPALLAGFQPQAVIPSNRTRKVLIAHDVQAYRAGNRIECCFSKLKHFRRCATRYDRRTVHFLGFVLLAAAMIWMR